MLRKTRNEDASRELLDKLKRAHMARDFAILRDAASIYHQRSGRYPANPAELVDAQIINISPKEPFGGEYSV